MSDKGRIELEHRIDSITVGVRNRKDPGDPNADEVDLRGRTAPAGHHYPPTAS